MAKKNQKIIIALVVIVAAIILLPKLGLFSISPPTSYSNIAQQERAYSKLAGQSPISFTPSSSQNTQDYWYYVAVKHTIMLNGGECAPNDWNGAGETIEWESSFYGNSAGATFTSSNPSSNNCYFSLTKVYKKSVVSQCVSTGNTCSSSQLGDKVCRGTYVYECKQSSPGLYCYEQGVDCWQNNQQTCSNGICAACTPPGADKSCDSSGNVKYWSPLLCKYNTLDCLGYGCTNGVCNSQSQVCTGAGETCRQTVSPFGCQSNEVDTGISCNIPLTPASATCCRLLVIPQTCSQKNGQCRSGTNCLSTESNLGALDCGGNAICCSGGSTNISNVALSSLKKLSLTREIISSSTNDQLFSSACLYDGECLVSENYTAKCATIASLRADGTLTEVQQTSLFSRTDQILNGALNGAGFGIGIGVLACVGGNVLTATGIAAGVGIPLAVIGCPALLSGGTAIGGAVIGAAIGNIQQSDTLLVKLKAHDASSVGICTATPGSGGGLCISQINSFMAPITKLDCQTNTIIFFAIIALLLIIIIKR